MNKRQQRAAKIAEQQALMTGAQGRSLTDAEQAQFDALQREIDALTLEIEAEERQADEGETRAQEEADAGTAQRAMIAERNRVTAISDLCRDFDVDPAEHIRNGSSIDQVRAAILENLRNTNGPADVQVTRDEEENFRERATDALMMRAGINVESPADGAQERDLHPPR